MRNKIEYEQPNYVVNENNYAAHNQQRTAGNISVQSGSNRLHAARSNEKYPATNSRYGPPSSGLSQRRESSSKDFSSKGIKAASGSRQGAGVTAGQFNTNRQQHQKALLTTQLNFPSSKQQIYQQKRGMANSGYSSRNATATQNELNSHMMGAGPKGSSTNVNAPPGTAVQGLSNKIPSHGGDNQRSNDYLRLKRVNNMLGNNVPSTAATNGADSTSSTRMA